MASEIVVENHHHPPALDLTYILQGLGRVAANWVFVVVIPSLSELCQNVVDTRNLVDHLVEYQWSPPVYSLTTVWVSTELHQD